VTPSLRLVLVLIFGIVVVGLATLNGSVMVLAIPLIVYLAAAIALRPEQVAFAVTRTVSPDRAPQGAPVNIKVSIVN